MTSYTDKHLAKAKDVLPRLFSDENVATNHDGDAAYVGDRCLAVIAEAIANAERDAFKRASEMLDLLIEVFPYMETAESDEAYKAGAVAKVTAKIRAAISKAEGR